MRGLRALCAALLFVAFTLGVPLHSATAHRMAHAAGGTTMQAAHAYHAHAHGKPCRDCPTKAKPDALCQMACAAAVAVLDAPAPSLGTRLAYAVRFAVGPPALAQSAIVAPDPFPPRPSRSA